jgi:hypothetical protein
MVHLPKGSDVYPNGMVPGGTGPVTVVVQAWDASSVDQWLRRGGDVALAEAVVPKIPGVLNRHGLRR